MREKTVAEIAEHIGTEKACLLIGAGVSLSAGVGLAADFVAEIKAQYPSVYERLFKRGNANTPPSYAECMGELTDSNRAKLVRKAIENAKINSAHIGIARLEQNNLLNAVLTTNFDPLVSRGCAMFNRFPAIYDLAGLRDQENQKIHFDGSYINGSAIFHLHGQHTGFELLNTDEKLLAQAKRIRPVLDAVMRGKPVIIAGYSGENDPLVDEIAELAPFNHGLFWVCHNDEEPARNVRDKLLSLKDCFIVRNMPADKFFPELANKFKCPSPKFLTNPFQHMLDVMDTLATPEQGLEIEGVLIGQARDMLENANQKKQTADLLQTNISELMASGEYEAVWQQYNAKAKELDSDGRNLLAWAAVQVGNAHADQASEKHGDDAYALFAQAGEKYAAALAIKPDMHEALNNWGNIITEKVNTKRRDVADALFAQACEKYDAALAIRPDYHEAFNNWGNTLAKQAGTKRDDASDALFAQASEKYAAALAIKPDKHRALRNWGDTLTYQAGTKQGDAADTLFARAYEKYAAALAIKPDDHQALGNWGAALTKQADTKHGDAADTLFAQAYEKYASALIIKPNYHEALNNWGIALSKQAQTKQGDEADALFAQACDKYAAAIAIKPDAHEALNSWGATLINQASTRDGDERLDLLSQAEGKLLQAETLRAGSAAYNLACLYGLRGDAGSAAGWLRKAKAANIRCPDCESIAKEIDFDAVRNAPEFVQALADIGC